MLPPHMAYLSNTFTDLLPILTIQVSPALSEVLMVVVSEVAVADPNS